MNETTKEARWNSLIEGFRSFGGIADNLIQRKGALGLGLFPIDSSKPVELRVPDHLLVSTDNIELREGSVFLKDTSGYPEGFAEWYAHFQAEYSWGAEARHSIKNFENGLRSLPDSLQQKLQILGLINISHRFPGIDEEQELFQRFITTRQINRKGNKVLMPIMELVNHSPLQQSWTMDDNSITIQGKYENEILVRYSIADPLRRCMQYGFNCKEPFGFSLNIRLIHNNRKVVVKGGFNFNSQPLKPSDAITRNEIIIINNPLLSALRNPRMPKSNFRETCKNIKNINADELFEQIHQRNRLIIINIILLLNEIEGQVSDQIKEACLDQIAILGEHYGTRLADN